MGPPRKRVNGWQLPAPPISCSHGWPRRWADRNSHRRACTANRKLENRHDVNEIVRDWCGSLTRDEVLKRCYATGAPAGPLNNIADIFGGSSMRDAIWFPWMSRI